MNVPNTIDLGGKGEQLGKREGRVRGREGGGRESSRECRGNWPEWAEQPEDAERSHTRMRVSPKDSQPEDELAHICVLAVM